MKHPSKLSIVIDATPETLTGGTVWFGSAVVSGIVEDERFSATFDFSRTGFATPEQAKRYAEERIHERLADGLFHPPVRREAGDASLAPSRTGGETR
jgi:hypothetical protein